MNCFPSPDDVPKMHHSLKFGGLREVYSSVCTISMSVSVFSENGLLCGCILFCKNSVLHACRYEEKWRCNAPSVQWYSTVGLTVSELNGCCTQLCCYTLSSCVRLKAVLKHPLCRINTLTSRSSFLRLKCESLRISILFYSSTLCCGIIVIVHGNGLSLILVWNSWTPKLHQTTVPQQIFSVYNCRNPNNSNAYNGSGFNFWFHCHTNQTSQQFRSLKFPAVTHLIVFSFKWCQYNNILKQLVIMPSSWTLLGKMRK